VPTKQHPELKPKPSVVNAASVRPEKVSVSIINTLEAINKNYKYTE